MPLSQNSQGSEEGEIVERPRGSSRLNYGSAPRVPPRSRTSTARREEVVMPVRGQTSQRPGGGTLADELRRAEPRTDRPPVPAFPRSVARSALNGHSDAAETIHVNYRPGPANMVTASQQERGISHGSQRLVGSDVSTSSDESEAEQHRPDKGKAPAVEPERDPYQESADRANARLEDDDPDYAGPSQDTPTPYDIPVPPEEIAYLSNAATLERSQTLGREDAHQVTFASTSAAAGQQRTPVSATKRAKRPYGIKHPEYDSLPSDAKRERDECIETIKANWPDELPWPEVYAPKRGLVLLDPKDVSTRLLDPIARLSISTAGDAVRAHRAMRLAVDNRLARKDDYMEQPEKLLPVDVEEAIESCKKPAKRSRRSEPPLAQRSVGEGQSPKRRRRSAGPPVQDAEPTEPDLQEPEAGPAPREKSVTVVPGSPQSPSDQLNDEMEGLVAGADVEEGPAVVSTERERSYAQTSGDPVPATCEQQLKDSSTGRLSWVVPSDVDWSPFMARRLEDLYAIAAGDGRAMGKDVVVSFSLS